MTSPEKPTTFTMPGPMDEATVHAIVHMIDDRRKLLDARWLKLERGSRESGELLTGQHELANLKWAILDVWQGREPEWD
jgi:hypothetical protein